ncbi:MAG: MgtC/SapB family protein [Bacteroidota bacterium]
MIPEVFIQLSLAVLCGAIIGFEREYSSKAAGFRTITMVTLGATLFTILSVKIGGATSPDRIASNIIVGIGFIGAGVVFKDGFNISGLTTASTIWISAAIGMAIGVSQYATAITTLIIAIIVLALFEKAQDFIEDIHQVRNYRINLNAEYESGKSQIEEKLKELKVKARLKKIFQTETGVSFFYTISGNQQKLNQFSEFLINTREVKSFEE